MTRVFEVDCLPGVPGPGQRAVLLTVRSDLDIATEHRARAQVRQVASTGHADAVLVDLGHAFVGVAVLRCLHDLLAGTGAGTPVAVVGAPRWLVELAPRLALPSLPYLRTVDSAVATLREGHAERA